VPGRRFPLSIIHGPAAAVSSSAAAAARNFLPSGQARLVDGIECVCGSRPVYSDAAMHAATMALAAAWLQVRPTVKWRRHAARYCTTPLQRVAGVSRPRAFLTGVVPAVLA